MMPTRVNWPAAGRPRSCGRIMPKRAGCSRRRMRRTRTVSVRAAAAQKWFGASDNAWVLRCDVYLHASAADYTKATSKDARWLGHSSLEVTDRRVTKRRIDLAGDGPDVLAAAVPREVTHLVLTD